MLRVQPLTPVKIDYEVLTLKEFAARFRAIVATRARCACTSRRSTIASPSSGARLDLEKEHDPFRHVANPQIRDAQCAAGVRLVGRQRAVGAGLA